MDIVQGSIARYRDQLEAVFQAHWLEIGMSGCQNLSLEINWPLYTYMEAFGKLVSVAAETSEGELAGYVIFMLYEHPHHRYNRFAVTDCFMLKKEYRSGFLAIKMFKFAEKLLMNMNVSHIQLAYDVKNPLEKLAKFMKYKKSNILFTKEL